MKLTVSNEQLVSYVYLFVMVKVGFLYSAAYTITGPACFTISEVAVDWQERMVLQHKLRPSISHINVQLDPRCAASKHTTTVINHIRPSPRKHSPDGSTHSRQQTSILLYWHSTHFLLCWYIMTI